MPQIAQQDYLYIKPVNAATVVNDAAALGQLRRAVDNGTIWDCLIYFPFLNEGESGPNISKVLSCYPTSAVTIYDNGNGQITIIEVPFTQQQYEGLAAIQRALIERGDPPQDIVVPEFGFGGGRLQDIMGGEFVCVNDHYLTPTVSGGMIAGLSLGDEVESEEDYVNITWEDAQKLIGLPINV